jgi:hypothetical protein
VDTPGEAGQPAVYEDNTYSYEDHLLDMGNAASSDSGAAAASGAEAPISAETEHNALAMRMQAITGAKPAETRATPRGPKAAQEDHPVIAVRDEDPGNGFVGPGALLTAAAILIASIGAAFHECFDESKCSSALPWPAAARVVRCCRQTLLLCVQLASVR